MNIRHNMQFMGERNDKRRKKIQRKAQRNEY